MASVADQINVEALDAVLKQVNKTYSALKALDSQMDASLINKFAKLAQGVNQFVNALKGIDELSAKLPEIEKGTKILSDFIKGIIALDQELRTAAGSLDSSPILKFSNAFYRLTLALNETSFDGRKINAIAANIGKLAAIPDKYPLAANFADYLKSLRSFKDIGDVFKSLESIKETPLGPGTPVAVFFDALVKLAVTTRGISFNEALLGIVTDVSKLFQALSKVTTENTNLNVAAMDRAFQQIQNFFKRIVEMTAEASLGTVLKARSLFPLLTDVLEVIFTFITKMARYNIGALSIDLISDALTRALTDVAALFRVIGDFSSTASLKDVYKFRKVAEPLLLVMDSITTIFQAVSKASFDIRKVEGITDVFKAVTEVVTTIGNFGATLTSKLSLFGALKFGYITNKITGVVAEVVKLFQAIGGAKRAVSKEVETFAFNGTKSEAIISVTDIQSIAGIFENINLLFNQLSTIKFGNGGEFSASLKGFFTGISGITSAAVGFVRFKVFSNFVRDFIGDLANLVKLTKDVDPASIAGLGDIFKSLLPILKYMVEFNTVWNAVKGGINKAAGALTLGRSMDATINAVKGVLFIAKDIPPETVKAVGEIFKGLALMFPAYADFARATNEAMKNGVRAALVTLPLRLLTMELTVRSIFNFVRNVVKLTDGISVEKTSAIGEFTRGIGTLFQGLSSAFRAISREVDKIGDFKSLIKYFVGVELLIWPIRRVTSALLNLTKGSSPEMLTAAGTFVRSIAQALIGVARAFEQAKYLTPDLGTILKTLFVFNKIISPIKEVAKIMASLPQGANFAGGAEYINAVSKFLTKMFKTFTDPAFMKDVPDAGRVKKFVGEIVNIFKAIKIPNDGFKGAADLVTFADKIDKVKDLEGIFKGFAAGISAFKDVQTGDMKSIFSSMGDGIVAFTKALDQLSPDQVDRLAKIGAAVKDLPVSDLSKSLNLKGGSGLSEVRDLSEDVAQGMQRANLRAAIFQGTLSLIGSVISAFDPRRPINLLVDGFNRATEALSGLKAGLMEAFENIREGGERMKDFGQSALDKLGIQNIVNSDIFKTTVEFDKLGSSLEVFGGLTKEQRLEAEEFANVLGKDYPLSANEALKATLDLVKAGQGFESAQDILPSAADLASLSDSGSIEQATGFIIQANAAFKEFSDTVKAGYENSAVAVDIIAAAADSSTASVESLAEGLANVGPVASQFGLTLEETSAILAIFTDGGIAGAEAGTQLKSFLTNLTTKTAQKELRNLGISITDTAGNFKPMNDILNEIQAKFTQTGTRVALVSKQMAGPDAERFKLAEKALAGALRQQFLLEGDLSATALGKNAEKKLAEATTIAENAQKIMTDLGVTEQEMVRITYDITRSEKQNAESLKKIAGSYGQSGLAILLSQGEDGLADFVAQMRAVEPASIRAKKALDNINGDMIQLQGSVETLTTKALLPLLEKFFRPFVQLGRFFIDTLLTMNDETLEFISTAIILGSTLATIFGGAVVAIGALIQLGGAVGGLSTFLVLGTKALTIGFLGALTGVAAGIAALAASFIVLTPILALITAGFNTLSTIFSQDLGGAATRLQKLGDAVGSALGKIGAAFGSILEFVSEVVNGGQLGSLEEVGKGFADFFGTIALSIRTSDVVGTLSDIGNIFSGFTKVLRFDAGSQKAADDAVAAIDNVNLGFKGKSARDAKKARDAYLKSYSTFLVGLAHNNGLLKTVLGDNTLSVEQVQAYLEKGVVYVEKVRDGIGRVFSGFGAAFASAQDVMKNGGNLGDGIGTFVSELGKNLDKSIGDLSATVLRALRDLFGFDTGALAAVFDAKGFGAGIAHLISKGLAEAKKFLLSNRAGVKGFLSSIFENIFLGTLNIGKFVADALGQESLGEFIQGITDSLKAVFGGVVDTVLNIIAGQDILTALKNAFGPGIQPFLDLVASLGKAVDNIVGFIGLLFSSLFAPPEGVAVNKEPFLLTLFNGLVTGLTGVIDFLNTNILNFLKTGDISGMITNLVNGVAASITELNLPEKFSTAAQSILNGLVSAVQSAFLTVTDALDLDPSGFITSVEASLTNFFDTIKNVFGGADGISIFDNIATIVDKLKIAFEALFGVFASTDAATTESKGPTIQSVLQKFFDMLGTSAGGIINTITDLADGLDKLVGALALLNPAELLAFTAAMGLAGGILALYAGGPAILTAFGAGFTAFSAGLTTLANSAAAKFAALMVIIQFIRAIAQNLDTFAAAARDVASLDIAGAIGKAFGGIVTIFTDLGFNLAELLGITEIFGLTRDEFTKIGAMIGSIMEVAVGTAGAILQAGLFSPIQDFIEVTIPLMLSELEKLGTSLAAKLPGGGEQQKQLERIGAIDATAFGQISFTGTGLDEKGRTPIEAFLEDVVAAGGSQTAKRLGTQAARDNALLYASAVADFDWLGTLDAETRGAVEPQVIANMVKFFESAGVSDDVLLSAAKDNNFGFMQAYIEGLMDQDIVITPEMQAKLAASISEGFNFADSNGALARIENLGLTIDTFTSLGLDTTQLAAEKLRLETLIANYLADSEAIENGTPTEVPVTVTPVVTTGEPIPGDGPDPYDPNSPNYIGKALFKDGAGIVTPFDLTLKPSTIKLDEMDDNDILTIQAGAQGQLDKIAATTPLATFDVSTLTDPAAVTEFNTLIGTLITNIQTLAGELTGVAGQSEPVGTALISIQGSVTTFRDVSVPLFTEVATAILPISGAVTAIQSALLGLFATAIAGFPATALAVTGSVAVMSGQFSALRNAADAQLQPVLTKVRDIASAFKDAATQARAFGSAVPVIAGGGGGGGNPPGRAKGGSTRPYSAYEVHDTNDPEIYNDGRRSLLLTGRDPGYVTPMSQMPNLSSNRTSGSPQRNLATGATTNNTLTVNQSPVQIVVNVTGGKGRDDGKAVADATKAKLTEMIKANAPKLGELLRTFHR